MMSTDMTLLPGIEVSAPASLSNIGPGYDAFGLCIDGVSDVVVAHRVEEAGVHLDRLTGLNDGIPSDDTNTAVVGAKIVLENSGMSGGIRIEINKGIQIGSGIGGSAASAVGGAVAANEVLGRPLSEAGVAEAGLLAEASVAGALHGDNVLPCLFGGFVLTTPGNPMRFQRHETGDELHIPLLLPQVTVLTENARRILPERVSHQDAVRTAAAAAHTAAAMVTGNWPALGLAIMDDCLVEPYRAELISFYSSVKRAALRSGAFGCAISGSGPAMFAVTDSAERAEIIAESMLLALRTDGFDGLSLVTRASNEGVQVRTLP